MPEHILNLAFLMQIPCVHWAQYDATRTNTDVWPNVNNILKKTNYPFGFPEELH